MVRHTATFDRYSNIHGKFLVAAANAAVIAGFVLIVRGAR